MKNPPLYLVVLALLVSALLAIATYVPGSSPALLAPVDDAAVDSAPPPAPICALDGGADGATEGLSDGEPPADTRRRPAP